MREARILRWPFQAYRRPTGSNLLITSLARIDVHSRTPLPESEQNKPSSTQCWPGNGTTCSPPVLVTGVLVPRLLRGNAHANFASGPPRQPAPTVQEPGLLPD